MARYLRMEAHRTPTTAILIVGTRLIGPWSTLHICSRDDGRDYFMSGCEIEHLRVNVM